VVVAQRVEDELQLSSSRGHDADVASPPGTDLVPEQRALALFLGLRTVASGSVVAVFPSALAEQFRKQLHGRFPLTETDPPVGQDEL